MGVLPATGVCGDQTGEPARMGFMTESVHELGSGERPRPLNIHVRNQMRRMPRAGSAIERAVRSELHRRGLRFRVNLRGMPGTPDIAFTRARIAVFIDGCFWHACPVHGGIPKNNGDWWEAKLLRNQERDREKDAALEIMGWLPLHYWEHDDPEEIADEVEWVWRDLIFRRR